MMLLTESAIIALARFGLPEISEHPEKRIAVLVPPEPVSMRAFVGPGYMTVYPTFIQVWFYKDEEINGWHWYQIDWEFNQVHE